MTQKVEFEATLKGNGADKLLTTVVKLEQEVRDLKAAFANMGVDADKALGKTTTGLQRTKSAFEKFSGAVVSGTANQSAAYNRDLERFKAKCLAENAEREKQVRIAAGQLANQKQTELKANAQALADFKAKCLAENAAAFESFKQKTLATNEYVREKVRANKRIAMDEQQLAAANMRERLKEARALRDSGDMTPGQFQVVRRGISKQYYEESGRGREDRKIRADEERRRQSDQQAGIRLVEQHATAQERFNVRIARATQLKKDQHISEAVFKREVAAANKELREQTSLFSGLQQQAAGYLTVAAGIGTAWRIARMEFQNYKDAQNDAKNATMSFGQIEEQAIKNLDGSITANQMTSMVRSEAVKRQMNPVDMMRSVNSALGSRGNGVTAKQAIDTVFELSEFTRLNPMDSAPTVAAVLQMQSVNPKASVKGLYGQMAQAQISSKVADPALFAKYMAPRMSAAHAFGDTPEQAAGIGAYLANAAGDDFGRVASSGLTDWEKDLDILANAYPGLGNNSMERILNIARNPKFKGLQDKLLAKNEDPHLQDLFKKAGRMTTESRTYGPIKLAYQNDPRAIAALQEKIAEQVDSGKGGEAVADRLAAGLQSTPTQQTARLQSRVAATVESARLSNQTGAKASISRDAIRDILKATGSSRTQQILSGLSFELDTNGGETQSVENLMKQLGTQQNNLGRGSVNLFKTFSKAFVHSGGPGGGLQFNEPTAAQTEQANAIRELLEFLKSQAEKSREPVVNVQVAPGLQVRNNNRPVAPRAAAVLSSVGATAGAAYGGSRAAGRYVSGEGF